MALNKEEITLKDAQLAEVRELLKKSNIYTDVTKILNAYNQSKELESDDIFCVNVSNGEKKFSMSKYMEARKSYESGKLQSEIDSLSKKISTHKYIMNKNRERDKELLKDLLFRSEKIGNFASLVDAKKEWINIIRKEYPDASPNSYVHSLEYFMELYKDLAISMEKACYRNKEDSSFAEKLNNKLEIDVSRKEENPDQGRDDFKFIMTKRKDFIKSLDKNKQKLKEISEQAVDNQNLWSK